MKAAVALLVALSLHAGGRAHGVKCGGGVAQFGPVRCALPSCLLQSDPKWDCLERLLAGVHVARLRGGLDEGAGNEECLLHREFKPKKRRSRRRQMLLNMKKDNRPDSAKPKGSPSWLQKDSNATMQGNQRHIAQRIGVEGKSGVSVKGETGQLAQFGSFGASAKRGGTDLTRKDRQPGGLRVQDTAEKEAAERDDLQIGDLLTEVSGLPRQRPGDKRGEGGGGEGESAADVDSEILRRKAAKFRRLRKRWGADLERKDPEGEVVPLAEALAEQTQREQEQLDVRGLSASPSVTLALPPPFPPTTPLFLSRSLYHAEHVSVRSPCTYASPAITRPREPETHIPKSQPLPNDGSCPPLLHRLVCDSPLTPHPHPSPLTPHPSPLTLDLLASHPTHYPEAGSNGVNLFEWSTLGESLAMTNGNRTVFKVENTPVLSQDGFSRPAGEFALWGAPGAPNDRLGVPESNWTWGVRVDKMSGGGGVWLGLLVPPFKPAQCVADLLETRAWMMSDAGMVVRTGRGGREELTGRARPKLPPAHKMSFRERCVVVMTREQMQGSQSHLSSLVMQVYHPGVVYETPQASSPRAAAGSASGSGKTNKKKGERVAEVRLEGISARGARPFVNLLREGDRVTLIAQDELAQTLKLLRGAPAKAAAKERKAMAHQRRKEEVERLRQAIEADDEVVLGAGTLGRAPGPVAEVLDKELHRDSLFDDDSSGMRGYSASSLRSASSNMDTGDLLSASGGSALSAGSGEESGGRTRENAFKDVFLGAVLAQDKGRKRNGDEIDLSDIDPSSSLSFLDTFGEGRGGKGEVANAKAAEGAGQEAGGQEKRRAGVHAPVIVKYDFDDDDVEVVKVRTKKKAGGSDDILEAQA
jgi:hypothetical protein